MAQHLRRRQGIRIDGQVVERGVVVVLVGPLANQDGIARLCRRDVDLEQVVEDPVDVNVGHRTVIGGHHVVPGSNRQAADRIKAGADVAPDAELQPVAILGVHQLEPAGPSAAASLEILRHVHSVGGERLLLDPQLDADPVALQRGRAWHADVAARTVQQHGLIRVAVKPSSLTKRGTAEVRTGYAVVGDIRR